MTVTADSILVRGSCSSITTTSCPPSGRAGGPPTMSTMKRGPPMPLEALRDRLLLMRATKSPMSPLTEEECISVADQASMIFASEPILLYIEPPINIYGDTHGMSLAIRGMRNCGRKPWWQPSFRKWTELEMLVCIVLSCVVSVQLRISVLVNLTHLRPEKRTVCFGVFSSFHGWLVLPTNCCVSIISSFSRKNKLFFYSVTHTYVHDVELHNYYYWNRILYVHYTQSSFETPF